MILMAGAITVHAIMYNTFDSTHQSSLQARADDMHKSKLKWKLRLF